MTMKANSVLALIGLNNDGMLLIRFSLGSKALPELKPQIEFNF